MRQSGFLLGFGLLALLAVSTAYKKCIDVKSVHTDEDWFKEEARDGFHLVEHSNCDNCENNEDWSWLKAGGRSGRNNKMCWRMDVTTHYGDYNIPFDCKYNQIHDQDCRGDFSKTDIGDKIAFGGSILFTHTDNKTYVAGTTCIFGKENFWWIMATDKDSLQPHVKDQIYEDFMERGFRPNNVATRDSVLFVKRLSSEPHTCDGRRN